MGGGSLLKETLLSSPLLHAAPAADKQVARVETWAGAGGAGGDVGFYCLKRMRTRLVSMTADAIVSVTPTPLSCQAGQERLDRHSYPYPASLALLARSPTFTPTPAASQNP